MLAALRGTVAALGAALALGAPPADAVTPSCGSVLVADTTFDSDLTCVGAGVIIGADSIVVDLAGFKLKGDGTGIGVDNTGGFDGVTITNGVIDKFANGVVLTDASTNLLTDLQVKRSVGTGPGGGGTATG